jgi:hypothetical protein
MIATPIADTTTETEIKIENGSVITQLRQIFPNSFQLTLLMPSATIPRKTTALTLQFVVEIGTFINDASRTIVVGKSQNLLLDEDGSFISPAL